MNFTILIGYDCLGLAFITFLAIWLLMDHGLTWSCSIMGLISGLWGSASIYYCLLVIVATRVGLDYHELFCWRILARGWFWVLLCWI